MVIDFGVAFEKADAPFAEGALSVLLCRAEGEADRESALHRAKARGTERVFPFCPVQPDSLYALEYVWKASDEELRGISIQPLAPFYASDRRFFKVYDLARALGLVVSFDPLSNLPGANFIAAGPRELKEVARNFPGIRISSVCRGGLAEAEELISAAHAPDVCAVTSCRSGGPNDAEILRRIVREHGAERILFSSGAPRRAFSDELNFVKGLKLPVDSEGLILGGNGARLLGL